MNFDVLKDKIIGSWIDQDNNTYTFTETELVKVLADEAMKKFRYTLTPVSSGYLAKITFGSHTFSVDIGQTFKAGVWVDNLNISGNGLFISMNRK